eukprot:scaffold10.g2273.t1
MLVPGLRVLLDLACREAPDRAARGGASGQQQQQQEPEPPPQMERRRSIVLRLVAFYMGFIALAAVPGAAGELAFMFLQQVEQQQQQQQQGQGQPELDATLAAVWRRIVPAHFPMFYDQSCPSRAKQWGCYCDRVVGDVVAGLAALLLLEDWAGAPGAGAAGAGLLELLRERCAEHGLTTQEVDNAAWIVGWAARRGGGGGGGLVPQLWERHGGDALAARDGVVHDAVARGFVLDGGIAAEHALSGAPGTVCADRGVGSLLPICDLQLGEVHLLPKHEPIRQPLEPPTAGSSRALEAEWLALPIRADFQWPIGMWNEALVALLSPSIFREYLRLAHAAQRSEAWSWGQRTHDMLVAPDPWSDHHTRPVGPSPNGHSMEWHALHLPVTNLTIIGGETVGGMGNVKKAHTEIGTFSAAEGHIMLQPTKLLYILSMLQGQFELPDGRTPTGADAFVASGRSG